MSEWRPPNSGGYQPVAEPGFVKPAPPAGRGAASPARPAIDLGGACIVGIPQAGQVLFVIHVDDEQLADDGGEAVVADLYRLAEKLAPGRAQVAVMTSGITLEVLTDEQLAPLGLQRISGGAS